MNDDTLAPLFPDVAAARRVLPYVVEVTVPHAPDPGTVMPPELPAVPHGKGVLALLTASRAVISVRVSAPSLLEAAVMGLAAAGEWARMTGAEVTVRPT